MPKIKFGRNRQSSDITFLGREIRGFTAPVVVKIYTLFDFFYKEFLVLIGALWCSRIMMNSNLVVQKSNRKNGDLIEQNKLDDWGFCMLISARILS